MGESAVFQEVPVIAVVSQVVEGFVGIFDGDLRTCGRGSECFDHGVVKMCAVSMGMVGRENEELGYSSAGGKRCG